MLRITKIPCPELTTLKVEGKLLGAWVDELRTSARTGDSSPIALDLTARVDRWDDPGARAAESETRAQVRQMIDELAEDYRQVLLLRDIEELGTAETACLLNTTEGNVKTRRHRARQALRSRLERVFWRQ